MVGGFAPLGEGGCRACASAAIASCPHYRGWPRESVKDGPPILVLHCRISSSKYSSQQWPVLCNRPMLTGNQLGSFPIRLSFLEHLQALAVRLATASNGKIERGAPVPKGWFGIALSSCPGY